MKRAWWVAICCRGSPPVYPVPEQAGWVTRCQRARSLRYGAPIVVVVYDDEKWGAIALPQQRAYGTEIEMSLPRRAWWKVMQAMGGHGEYVDDEADLGDALTRALGSRVPAVVQVKVPSVEAPYVEYHS